ncbi:hybrid sensor histidine kinase/response regulator [Spartinivicinus poritis]|uniref:histidine kinase n=1 Tax=Spartinivicinus poritis TaxID=2994640 RepID=A0ABT5UGT0_9GAMM|nr:hybrid sensor histidine kinase/response regulator [Spartinivicinus sp. A2-2]MDE1464264.1 response regulator [Spartinivicinus sp. A2-2]
MVFDITAPNILVVDDDIKTCQQLKHLIKEFGYQCGFIINPKNLFPRLEEEKFDLILLDLNMPGLNGVDLLLQLSKKEEFNKIVIIVLTAEDNNDEVIAKCYKLGVVNYISKPVNKLILEARLNNALAAKQARDSLECSVLERTRDLEILNEHLVNEIKVRRTYEKDLISAKVQADSANKAKSEFLANMSHELRTPMNAILGTVQILEETNINQEQKELIDVLKGGGERLLNLINNVLDLSKIEANKLEVNSSVFSLHQLIDSTYKLLVSQAKEKGICLNYSIGRQVPDIIKSDSNKLNQILINLMGNAIKFTKEGGVDLHVTTEKSERGKALLLFNICDTGIGIEKNKQSMVFDSFTQVEDSTTRNYQGSGLGLTITKKLVEMLSGEIWLESEVNKGSQFYFTISCELVKEDSNNIKDFLGDRSGVILNPNKTVEKIDFKNERKWKSVLLVEDDPASRMIAKSILSKKFDSVETAVNGEEALEKFKEDKWNIVFMDMQMPLLNGYEAVRRIRAWECNESLVETPIIAMTAYALDGDDKKCTDAGCTGYLTKPINKNKLYSMLHSLLT